jgi:hypothetical protein
LTREREVRRDLEIRWKGIRHKHRSHLLAVPVPHAQPPTVPTRTTFAAPLEEGDFATGRMLRNSSELLPFITGSKGVK